MVGGVNLDCVLTSAGESGMMERFPVRSEQRQRRQKILKQNTLKEKRAAFLLPRILCQVGYSVDTCSKSGFLSRVSGFSLKDRMMSSVVWERLRVELLL